MGGVSGGEIESALAFLAGLGSDKVVADGDAVDVADHDEAHAPDVLALRRAIAEAGVGSELAAVLAAGVVGAADQRPVDRADRVLSDQLGDHHLHFGELRCQTPRPRLAQERGRTGGRSPGRPRRRSRPRLEDRDERVALIADPVQPRRPRPPLAPRRARRAWPATTPTTSGSQAVAQPRDEPNRARALP